MIYPTARAVLLAAAGAPVALAVGLAAPGGWLLAAGWAVLLIGLVGVDALIGPSRAAAVVGLEAPGALAAAGEGEIVVRAAFEGAAPRAAQVTVQTDARLRVAPHVAPLAFDGPAGETRLSLRPVRRGRGEIAAVWLRWTGTLGLVWKQVRERVGAEVAIVPDIAGVKSEAIRLFSREAVFGLKAQLDTGEGSEFHALREVEGAVDPRAIDWKQSARHGKLLAKEFRVERNHPVVFAIDTGRAMCEPLAGAPRLDRAINAALLLAYVCLKTGDLAGAYGFGARPGAFSGVLSGTAAFPRLQRHLAALDYGDDETNYTLGLSQLGAALKRRSLIVVFTEFADATSAELMVENIQRLLRRHVILFVALRDAELEAIVQAEPEAPEAVSRAVTAHAMMRQRDLVVARLTRLGVTVVDASAERLGPALISAWLEIKRAERL